MSLCPLWAFTPGAVLPSSRVMAGLGTSICHAHMCHAARLACWYPAHQHHVPRRAFVWAAKAGKEQLPCYPEPTHLSGVRNGIPTRGKDCDVDFQTKEAMNRAYPMVSSKSSCHSTSCSHAMIGTLGLHNESCLLLEMDVALMLAPEFSALQTLQHCKLRWPM